MDVKTRILLAVSSICLMSAAAICFAAKVEPPAAQPQPPITPLEEKPTEATVETKPAVAEVNVPPGATPSLSVKEVRIVGNTLVSTEELLKCMPDIYNTSKKPLEEAPPNAVFDLKILKDIISNPGQVRDVSTRSIQGLTRYILSVYQQRNYAGIYVYVPADTFAEGKLKDDILSIRVLEAGLSDVGVTYRDVNGVEVEKGRLKLERFRDWSPAEVNQVANKKKLDDFINLLNLNPDRRVYATVSPGAEPGSLTLKYDIYEANPWHYFIQVDNAGTDDREYAPRIGVINTNLLGIDDRFTVIYQAPWEKGIEESYSVYGSYDFPIMGPRLRLELFGGYSEFDVEGGGGIDFLGHGSVYGGKLRYNAFQSNGWFFDLTTSLSRENSKVSSSIFSSVLGSEVVMHLWGLGIDIHRRNDIANTSFIVDYIQNLGGSPQRKFWDLTTSTGARTNADRDFAVYVASANHSQYLDAAKIQRLNGYVRWIVPDARLVPSRMTIFGGMYSVRGYKESGIVADGGILASAQYEYDLVRANQVKDTSAAGSNEKPCLRKLAPVAFFDYGRARMEDKVPGEKSVEDMYSVGFGGIAELGDNFSGAVYYGFPLEATTTTDTKDGMLNFSVMMRW